MAGGVTRHEFGPPARLPERLGVPAGEAAGVANGVAFGEVTVGDPLSRPSGAAHHKHQ